MKQTFSIGLLGRGPDGSWTHMPIPFNVEKAFGTKARVAVRGTINGFAYRSSIMPRGDGTHYMAVNRQMQEGANAGIGDTVKVVMVPDPVERTVTVPADLKKALAGKAKADRAFGALSYSHRKEYVDWIEQAKKPETRARRVGKCLKVLTEPKTPKA
jgi:hypothetical protein